MRRLAVRLISVDQPMLWQMLSYFPKMHLTGDKATRSLKVKTPSGFNPACVLAHVYVSLRAS